jgi:hypothetical protein
MGDGISSGEVNLSPLRNSVNGMKSADAIASLMAKEPMYNIYGQGDGSRMIYVLGPYGGDAGITTSQTTKTNIEALANTVWAMAPQALVVLSNSNDTPGYGDEQPMNAGVRGAYLSLKAANKKVLFSDQYKSIPASELTGDLAHPSAHGYWEYGKDLFNTIYNYFYPHRDSD